MSLLQKKMLKESPPDKKKLKKLENEIWWKKNFGYLHKKTFILLALTILAMSFIMFVSNSTLPYTVQENIPCTVELDKL